jgi:hypothetical protein
MEPSNKTEAEVEREQQRSESEARDIIHDIGRLYTFPEEKKSRWVWELLQNAKDVATGEGVDIEIELTENQLKFTHNGLPFATKHLLAILYKTSTKSLDGQGGTTGKYGTGFVTTHILNKKLSISGVHEDSSGGKRRFLLEIDRTAASLDESIALKSMQESLLKTFDEINKISSSPADVISENENTFIYELTPTSFPYALRGIQELERNIAFTLLINQGQGNGKKINSITIKYNGQSNKHNVSIKSTVLNNIKFISSGQKKGILFTDPSEKLVFGIPAIETEKSFELLPIENQAVLFKEFPLIGTENFNLPVFIQHVDFHPTELRDGIRTKKESEELDDPTADINRAALLEFIGSYLPFVEQIISSDLTNTYQIAKSGLPEFVETYSNTDWYMENIQKPMRSLILQKPIVKTCAGILVEIAKSKFPAIPLIDDEEFYSLLAQLFPTEVPDKGSLLSWGAIIAQQEESWQGLSTINQEELVKYVPQHLDVTKEFAFNWLKDLYTYLDSKQLTVLGEKFPIYLNEAMEFCLRDSVAIYPDIDNEFKEAAKGLGRNLDKEFLHHHLGTVKAIKQFETAEFYNHLNTELISKLFPEKATQDQIAAIFRICCLYKTERSSKREQWFAIINQLLPTLAESRRQVKVDYENPWFSAELWSIKYICHLIEKSIKPSTFSQQYFEGHSESMFEWMNKFLDYVFELKSDNNATILKRKIIPTQADEFVEYSDFIFSEQNPKYFDNVIKSIYTEFCKKGDARRFLVDNRIQVDGIRKSSVEILTNHIDKIFDLPDIESRVKKEGPLNDMFLRLNSWFEQFSEAGSYLRTFSAKRPTLYVLALGDGFTKQIMEIQDSGKSIEDIGKLAKISLSAEDMKKFDDYAAELGTERLLSKAQELLESKKQIDRWKQIGKAAEDAFSEAIKGIELEMKIENPDLGKDFEVILNAKGYSIEIKNVTEGKENVRMSILQGRTAVREKDHYALCVMTRPNDEEIITTEYFKENARFVTDIGTQIGDKISNWDSGLNGLLLNDEIRITIEDKKESVYVNRSIWRGGCSFTEFVEKLKLFFSNNAVN